MQVRVIKPAEEDIEDVMSEKLVEEMIFEELKYRATESGRSIQAEAQSLLNHQPPDAKFSPSERMKTSLKKFRELRRIINGSDDGFEDLCIG